MPAPVGVATTPEPEAEGGIVKSGLAFLRRLKNDE
jgi:hypothetical protein